MFAQAFKNLDDVLGKEAGCSTELDYTEQSSWMLFLKYLDDMEADRADSAFLVGEEYEPLFDDAHRWSTWAAPHQADGNVFQRCAYFDSNGGSWRRLDDLRMALEQRHLNRVFSGGGE